MTFHIFDLVLLVLVAVSAFFAWRRGFVAETLSVIAWVLAFFGALYCGPWLSAHINVSPHWLNLALGYVLVFIAILLLVSFLAHYIGSSVKASRLGSADRGLGLIYGLIRAMVLIAVLYIFFFSVLELKQPHWLTNARTYPAVRQTAAVLMDLIPDRIDSFTIMPKHKSASAAGAHDPHTAKADTGKIMARAEPEVEASLLLRKTKQKDENNAAHALPAKRPETGKKVVKTAGSAKEAHSGYSRDARNALDKLIEKNGEKEDR